MREEMDIQDSFLVACAKGDIEKVKSFLGKGAVVDYKDEFGCTPLVIASTCGCIGVIKLLLEKGADIETKDEDGNTLLIWASAYGRIKVVKFLIRKGIDIEDKNIFGKTFYNYLDEEDKNKINFLLEDIEERKRMIKPCSF